MIVADGDGIPCMQKKVNPFPVYQTVRTKSSNYSPVDYYTRKLLLLFISVLKPFVNTCIISTENYRLATVWKPLINISEDHENRSRLPFQFEFIVIPVYICHS